MATSAVERKLGSPEAEVYRSIKRAYAQGSSILPVLSAGLEPALDDNWQNKQGTHGCIIICQGQCEINTETIPVVICTLTIVDSYSFIANIDNKTSSKSSFKIFNIYIF